MAHLMLRCSSVSENCRCPWGVQNRLLQLFLSKFSEMQSNGLTPTSLRSCIASVVFRLNIALIHSFLNWIQTVYWDL